VADKRASVLLNWVELIDRYTIFGHVDFAVPGQTRGVATADFNRDAKPDLAVTEWTGANGTGPKLAIRLNTSP